MFIEVKYGPQKSCLMNPDCRHNHFVDYLVKKLKDSNVQFETTDFIDLVCVKTVTIINLRSLKKESYVSSVTEDREVYVPIVLKALEMDQNAKFTVLLEESEEPGQPTLQMKLMQTLTNISKGKSPKGKYKRSTSITPEPGEKRRRGKKRVEPRSASKNRRS